MKRRLLLWGVVALSGFGCGTHEDGIEKSTEELYVAGARIWTSLSVPVCWDNPGSGNLTERGWVRNKIAATWSSASYVTFTGWQTCSAGQPGIHIRINDEQPHAKALGRDLDGMAAGVVLNFTFANWSPTCQSSRQFCIEAIAAHEFGHALGFAHEQNRPDTPASCHDAPQGSNGDTTVGPWDPNSIMNYCAPNWSNGGNLSSGDITGVRQYYGSPTFAANRKAAVSWPNGKIYFFNGQQYTRYDIAAGRADSGYPASIPPNWRFWPATWTDGVDAALDWGNGKAYFFRGSEYVRYDVASDRVDAGYPVPIATYWRGWPANWTSVDAAVKWFNGKVYFFRGAQFLSYDIAADRVDPGFPQPIATYWPGLFTSNVDYAFLHQSGNAFFFKGTRVQQFNLAANYVLQEGPIPGTWPGVPF